MKFHGGPPNSENEKPSTAPISVPSRRSREAFTVAPTFDCSTMMALMEPQ